MKKYLPALIAIFLILIPATGNTQVGSVFDQAEDIQADTAFFNNRLSSEANVQTSLDRLDDIIMTHATDCTALTIGKEGDFCIEDDSDRIFICDPSVDACDTAGEWKQVLIADGTNCAAGTFPLGIDGQGNVQGCTVDDDVPESGDFAAAVDLEADGSLSVDVVAAAEMADADHGDISWSSGVASVDANSVVVGTDTTGNYVATITPGDGLDSTGAASGENIAHILSLDLMTATNGVGTTNSASGLEFISGEISVLQGCADGEILKWQESNDTWRCATDGGGGGSGDVTSSSNIDDNTLFQWKIQTECYLGRIILNIEHKNVQYFYRDNQIDHRRKPASFP